LITVVRIGLLVFFTFLSLFIAATPASFLPVSPDEFPYFDLTKYYQYHMFFFLYYLLAAVVLALALTYLANKGRFSGVARSMRPAQTVFFAAIVGAGIVSSWRANSSVDIVSNILESPFWVNLAFLGVAIVAAILAWQASTIWNDLSDRGSDSAARRDRLLASGLLSPRTLLQVSLILAFGALVCSALLSAQQLLVIGLILALSYLYSFRPVRFKDHILSPLLIGLGTFLAFIFGCLTPYSVVESVYSPSGDIFYLTGEVAMPSLAMESFLLGSFMFLGLVVGSMVTDLDGYEEDSRAGVRTVYTRLGRERGVRIVALLIVAAALTPLVLFHDPLDVAAFVVLGGAAAALFVRFQRSRPVMLVAMVGLAYAALRYLEILQL
jgi:4-hydroxybenzoate polyprenyltransferase